MATLEAKTPWQSRYAQRTQRVSSSIIRELLKYTQKPGMISFGGGLPAPDAFPFAEVDAATRRVVENFGPAALQYGTTEGYLPLRELLVEHMERYGIKVTPDNVLITSGSQQALDFIGKLLINPGDHVLVEEPTYLGAIQAWNTYQSEYVTVPLDDDGVQIDKLEAALRTGPKFMYILPNFHNPAGVTLSLERRRKLVELAHHYGTPIVEDDPYGQLRYEGEHVPPLVKIDAEFQGNAKGGKPFTGNVIYLSTFSKTLAPGLRIAWIVAPGEVIKSLVQLKQGADLHTSTFCQYVAHEVAKDGFLDKHVKVIRKLYGERRLVMLEALEKNFPKSVRWTKPQGGLFLWVQLPKGGDSVEILKEALEENVAFVPGIAFSARGGGNESMRLNFSYSPPDTIREGIRRLSVVLKRHFKD